MNAGTWREFIEPWRHHTKREVVPSYQEGGAQFYEEDIACRYKSTVNLSYVLFSEKGEGKVGPRLIPQKQESE